MVTFKPDTLKLFALKSFLEGFYGNASMLTYRENLTGSGLNEFNIYFQEGIRIFKVFTRNCNFDFLLQAARKFAEAARVNPNKPEPYVYLAWLYFIADDKNLTAEYLRMAETINPNYPGIYQLKVAMN